MEGAQGGNNPDEPEGMTEDDKSKKEAELLYYVQGVGSIK